MCTLVPSPLFQDFLVYIGCIFSGSVIPLIFILTVVVFIWGVVQYVINDNEESKKAKGKMFMIYGIIGLTVMVGMWGLVNIVGNTFGVEYIIPQLQSN
ncbi:MAG: hypothetical protein WC839_03815 [Candidatus Paceibacterota bacterium]